MINDSLYRTIIVVTAITSVSVLAGIDLMHGGDGATITGAFTVIGGLVGYEFSQKTKADNSTPQ